MEKYYLQIVYIYSIILLSIFIFFRQKRLESKHYKQYSNNPTYKKSIILYSKGLPQKNILMLGDSLTRRANWAYLLDRKDVYNMGIDRDTTEGYWNRLEYTTYVEPKICFIEGGVNDLKEGQSIEVIIYNLRNIIYFLNKHNVIPVITKVIFLGKKYPNVDTINFLIHHLNIQIEQLAKSSNIIAVDLNSYLSQNGYLSQKYALSDGIHLNSLGYGFWAREVSGILKNKL